MTERKLPRSDDFRFNTRVRVRWAEVDMQGVVFYAHYLAYCDMAFMAYWRALALPFADTMQRLGGDLLVRHTAVDFLSSARPDDVLNISLRHVRTGESSITMEAAIFCQGRLLTRCELVYAYVDAVSRRGAAVPPALDAAMTAYEAGAAMTQVRTGDWTELASAATAVREAVFIREQGIAAAEELDAADQTAVHAVAFNRLGQAVGTARLLQGGADEPGAAHIGRMAVHHALRRTGLGRALMTALEDAAAARGDHAIVLSAQRHAQHFYEELGYRAEGEPYEEVRIPHIHMRKILRT